MKRRTRKYFKPLCIIVVFFCMLIWYYMLVLVPIIKTYCSAKINSITEQALNVAVSNVINTSVNYDNIMAISYSQSGEINYITANQYIINTISREIIKDANERVKMLNDEYINFMKGNLRNLKMGKINIDRERMGIQGATQEFYVFHHINDVSWNEQGELLRTKEVERLKMINVQNGIAY